MKVVNREDYIVENIALVHSIAKRFKGRGVEYDDLFQAGCLGLVKAVDNFDESRGFAFSTYAVPVIMGEIKRLFRDGGSIKVSRSLKEKAIFVKTKQNEFELKHFREPTVGELCEICNMETGEMNEVLEVMAPVKSLSVIYDDMSEEADIPVDDTDRMFDSISISEAMFKLDKSEQTLIKSRFFEGKTQTDTAKLLGISQVQVSRKERAVLQKLRELLAT
ncbi:MAG: sigma-70 family RNA polymerase sigma factor [Eubacterium sp.]|nr:sigma-70 family RNA polymerase sigma factor [Eubacterium sp.]MBR0412870.1 sigma-70 family RNA polymerase sigma factor [Eubacterium sp.]